MVATAILAVLLAMVSINAWRAADDRRGAEHLYIQTLDMLLTTSKLKTAIHSELRGERGYLLTHNPAFLAPYDSGSRAVPPLVAGLQDLAGDDRVQRNNIAALTLRIAEFEALLTTTIALERRGDHAAAMRIVRAGVGKHHIDAVMAALSVIDDHERQVMRNRGDLVERAMRRNDLYQYSLSALGFVLLIIAGAAAWSARRAERATQVATEELRRHATTDPLTGLVNRRAFFAELGEWIGSDRQRPCAVAIVDVDFFKRVNDRYGHPAGDQVLRSIAMLAQGSVRGTDMVARMGGEEFAVLMPGATLEQARGICERLRRAVREAVIGLDTGEQVRVTISAGIADRVAGQGIDEQITRADRALYDAKNAGRDRVLPAA